MRFIIGNTIDTDYLKAELACGSVTGTEALAVLNAMFDPTYPKLTVEDVDQVVALKAEIVELEESVEVAEEHKDTACADLEAAEEDLEDAKETIKELEAKIRTLENKK